jgi:hypothetical protein
MKPNQAKKGAKGPERAQYLSRPQYREAVEEAEKLLSFVFFRLDEVKADLAVEGAHKRWADAQGAVLMMDDIDFAKSADPLLRDLAELHAHLQQVLDRLPVDAHGKVRTEAALH